MFYTTCTNCALVMKVTGFSCLSHCIFYIFCVKVFYHPALYNTFCLKLKTVVIHYTKLLTVNRNYCTLYMYVYSTCIKMFSKILIVVQHVHVLLLSQFAVYFIYTKHVHYTIRTDSGAQTVVLVPHQSFNGSSMHFPAPKSLATQAIPENQAAILRRAETPVFNWVKTQVCQSVPPMDVFCVK